jgi:hypothetical protein
VGRPDPCSAKPRSASHLHGSARLGDPLFSKLRALALILASRFSVAPSCSVPASSSSRTLLDPLLIIAEAGDLGSKSRADLLSNNAANSPRCRTLCPEYSIDTYVFSRLGNKGTSSATVPCLGRHHKCFLSTAEITEFLSDQRLFYAPYDYNGPVAGSSIPTICAVPTRFVTAPLLFIVV